ncbi:hypothetical protein BJ508DRAFT_219179, partial [Ascobolus immersus RN42]
MRRILPALVIALEDPSIYEGFPFYECLAATRYLVDFSLICTYQFHTETSLGYLKTYLEGFHKHKHARYLDHGACWKIPKLHLLSHFIESIEKFGYLQQYSSEVGETLH